jgi:hypothetical protein
MGKALIAHFQGRIWENEQGESNMGLVFQPNAYACMNSVAKQAWPYEKGNPRPQQ